jgi:hypothetical protein
MNGGILKRLPRGLVLAIALVADASGVRAHRQPVTPGPAPA